jgi:hypothetical protein
VFTLKAELAPFELHGIEAVDTCRRLGLPPFARIVDAGQHAFGTREVRCTVGEKFARLWFQPSQVEAVVAVPLRHLVPGEVRFAKVGDRALCLENLSPERIQSLYIASLVSECRARAARLEVELADVRQRLDAKPNP